MAFRVALLGIYHESNTFVDAPTTLKDFKKGHYLEGEAIYHEYVGAHHEIGGMLQVMDEEEIEVLTLFYAEATPGGIITAETYNTLLTEMMGALDKALPVDGCLVVPHGAAVSQSEPDMDGHWLKLLREKLGDAVPVIGTLDPHANVSKLMAKSTNALVSYKTNPHIDQRQVGMEAARLMVKTLKKEIRPVQLLLQLPVAISIEQQYTAKEPCKNLYDKARQLVTSKDILSVSINLGFSYADVHEMGSSLIVIADDNIIAAKDVCNELASHIINNQHDFIGDKTSIDSAISLVSASEKPVLMLDMGDNVGGGSTGNSTVLLEAFEKKGGFKIFICIHDPGAVKQASGYSEGDKFNLLITGHTGPVQYYQVQLLEYGNGKFTETNPRHGGQVNFDMGKIAIVSTGNGSVIMFTSLRVSPFSAKQLTSFNIEPADFDVVIAKGVNAPIAAYAPFCPAIIQVNTPGVTQADMTLFKYKNRRKPLFPFETVTVNNL